MPQKTLGARLSHALKAHGVDTVFGIPGVHNIELYRGIEQAGITHILARHEQGAGFMADGYARATGKPGVALIISGPGLTNIMTPMGQAYSDSVPLLVISSCLPGGPAMPGRLHQMRDQTGAAAAVCDWSICATDPASAFELLDRAFAEFANKRSRPKHITIPVDVLEMLGESAVVKSVIRDIKTPDATAIEALASDLNRADRPLFIFGGGAVRASTQALATAEKTGAATFTTYAGRGIIDPSYPLNFGSTLTRPDSARVLARADIVVAVGTELAAVDLLRDQLGHRCTLARIDIDPEVLNDAHAADVKIRSDAHAALSTLIAHLKPAAAKWDAAEIVIQTRAFRAESDAEYRGIAPFVDALHHVLPADTLIFSDMTQFAYLAKEIYQMAAPGLWHHPFGFGTLGYALPAAIGGQIAHPNRPVVAIAGDYGFQYTMQELGVAAELSLPLVIILWDNGKLKEIEDAMIKSQIAPNAVVAQNPDFADLARAYGLGYAAPTSPDDFQTAVANALRHKGSTLVHISPE